MTLAIRPPRRKPIHSRLSIQSFGLESISQIIWVPHQRTPFKWVPLSFKEKSMVYVYRRCSWKEKKSESKMATLLRRFSIPMYIFWYICRVLSLVTRQHIRGYIWLLLRLASQICHPLNTHLFWWIWAWLPHATPDSTLTEIVGNYSFSLNPPWANENCWSSRSVLARLNCTS